MLKRRLESLYSPSTPTAKYTSPCKFKVVSTKMKLSFSPAESPLAKLPSPKPKFQLIEEDSCDSGFSDMQDSNQIMPEFVKVAREESDLNISIQEMFEFETTTVNQPEHEQVHEERLIGDLTRKHSLPIMTKSKHNDLASITATTLADLLDGKYNQIGKYLILDARYPYEFSGGHIQSAESAYSKDKIFDMLFKQRLVDENGEPLVLIFHCEFSSERGPRLMREIREKDRLINKHSYPNLYYPEMYLLEGGYKSFYESYDVSLIYLIYNSIL